jgi:hypothetical protein
MPVNGSVILSDQATERLEVACPLLNVHRPAVDNPSNPA